MSQPSCYISGSFHETEPRVGGEQRPIALGQPRLRPKCSAERLSIRLSRAVPGPITSETYIKAAMNHC